jgi:hypothetical protein
MLACFEFALRLVKSPLSRFEFALRLIKGPLKAFQLLLRRLWRVSRGAKLRRVFRADASAHSEKKARLVRG